MCVFCKIVNNELPAARVYEDEELLAFLDIKPESKGHLLLIPKKHKAMLEDLSEAEFLHLASVLKRLANNLLRKTEYRAYNLVLNNGAEAGQEIAHFHFHIIPRKPENASRLGKDLSYEAAEMEYYRDLLALDLEK